MRFANFRQHHRRCTRRPSSTWWTRGGFSRIPRFIKELKNTFFIMMINYYVSGRYRADLEPMVNVFILLLAVASCIAGGPGHDP